MIPFVPNILFGIADFVNAKLDPYEDFKRPFLPPETQITLHEKANRFHEQLLTKFRQPSGLFLYNVSPDVNDPDFGDQGLHHGLATAALAFGQTVGDVRPADVEIAMEGFYELFYHYKLIRSIDPRSDAVIADDASPDTAGGALCGLYFGAKYGGGNAGVIAIDAMKMLADELIANNYSLVNQDGSNTKYGKLINGFFTDPQRASLCLAILKAASTMSGLGVYREHFDKLYKRHGNLIRFAAFKFMDYTKSHEIHRSAIHLTILADLAFGEDPEMHDRCVGGLERIWKLSRKFRDPWIAALVSRHYKISQSDMREVILRLHEYPTTGKPGMTETLNSSADLSKYWNDRGVKFIKIQGNMRASQPLPYHRLPTQDFWPQRHPYMCDGFAGSQDTAVRHNAVDFLAPYWLLRKHNFIKADD